jgi:hypothetical protein
MLAAPGIAASAESSPLEVGDATTEEVLYRLNGADFLWMGLGFLAILAVSLALGRGRIFWEDEMLGWMVVTDPSWHHMLQAWKLGADGGGIAFYVTCRGWLHLFGPGAGAFRSYSATCFGLSFVLNWVTARRFYGRWMVGFALFNTYLFSPPIVLHLVEGRFYGLLMLSVALTFWLAVKLQDMPGRLPVPVYLFVFAAHALLTTSHLLGVVYSFFITLGMMLLDRMSGRWRPLLYGSAVVSWLLLLPELPAIRASAQVGKPWFWTTHPTLNRIVGAYTGYSGEIAAVLALLAILTMFSWRGLSWRTAMKDAFRSRATLYVLALMLLLVPVAFLAEGLIGPWLFMDRYLMPVAIATAIATAEMLHWLRWERLLPAGLSRACGRTVLRTAGTAGLAALAVWWIFVHLPPLIMAQYDYTGSLSAMLPKGVPVLMDNAWSFTEVIGRQHDSGVKYLYPLDWAQSTEANAPRLEVTQYNLMNNWRRVGYFSGSIVDLPHFLGQTPRFLMLQNEGIQHPEPRFIGNPLLLRFSKTPGYSLRQIGTLDDRGMKMTAWMVSHDPRTSGEPVLCGAVDADCASKVTK